VRIIIIFLVAFLYGTKGYCQDTKTLRNELFSLELNPIDIGAYLDKLELIDNPGAEIISYTGAACAFLARHISNPLKKIYYLNQSNRYLKKAVESDPDNVEIRFIRFLTQSQIPGILTLGYDVREDKKYIVDHLENMKMDGITDEMAQFLSSFLLKSKYCTAEEAEVLTGMMYESI